MVVKLFSVVNMDERDKAEREINDFLQSQGVEPKIVEQSVTFVNNHGALQILVLISVWYDEKK